MTSDKEMVFCLRQIHAAYDSDGHDLSAWASKAADEIERLQDFNRVLEAVFMESAKQIARLDPVGVAQWLNKHGLLTPTELKDMRDGI